MYPRLEPIPPWPMVVSTLLFLFGPLTLCVCVLDLATAARVWRTGRILPFSFERGTAAIWVLWIGGALLALISGVTDPNRLHDFWAVQGPMVALFLGSGFLLSRTWSDDAAYMAKNSEAPSTGERRINPAWLFLGMLLWLSLWPLALELAFPGNYVNPYSTKRPAWNLVELARWGLGGPVPTYLAEIGPDGVVHAHQNVPRQVTVPMGTTLIAAWLWIYFCVIALVGRIVPRPRLRIGGFLAAPIVIGVLWLAGLGGLPLGERLALDARYFGPSSVERSGIWWNEGATLASYGRVMLLAAICTAVLALALGAQRFISRRSSTAAALVVSPRSDATLEHRGADEPLRLAPRSGSAGLEGC